MHEPRQRESASEEPFNTHKGIYETNRNTHKNGTRRERSNAARERAQQQKNQKPLRSDNVNPNKMLG